jgi:AraC family transcriptional regulator, positive regulator of tynA and feaB
VATRGVCAQTFSTVGAPAPERRRLFGQALRATFSIDVDIDVGTRSVSAGPPLETEIVSYRGRRLLISSMRFSPHSVSSAGAAAKRSRLMVNLQKEGEANFAQGGRESRLTPGDMFLLDLSRPFHFESGAVYAHSIEFPAHTLRSLVPSVDELAAVPFKAYEGTAALFRAIFEELFALAPTLTDEVADRAADVLPSVLAAVLAPLEGAHEASPSSIRRLHKQRIRSFVLDHLSDPELDVHAVSVAVKLSTRYVHRLFADEPMTLMKWLWSERLERCHRELSTALLRGRSIGEIAYGWGFSDLAHFSRAFRERFGLSPRSLRASLG